jgi:predicted SAM-dependent methyltransferase
MKHDKLNFGCGARFSSNWVNVDFHSEDSRVQRVNLLSGFPFPDSSFQAVYSSHVLEHFERAQGRFLLAESYRVLRPGGLLRIVVPDLQGSCSEYLRVLSLPDGAEKEKLYSWVIIELLDQMVRSGPPGEMDKIVHRVITDGDEEFKKYIQSRTQNTPWQFPPPSTLREKLRKLTRQKLSTKMSYWYLRAVSLLIPKSLRSMVFVQTGLGERHRWMYDEYGLALLLRDVGFQKVRRVEFDESGIPGFNADGLDCNPDGEPYKNNSIYMEGSK